MRDDHHFLELAVERNASHGQQLSQEDKKQMAVQMYKGVPASERKDMKKRLITLFSVSKRTINNWLEKIDALENAKRDRLIQDMWMGCYEEKVIAEEVGLDQSAINKQVKNFMNLGNVAKIHKLEAEFQDEHFTPPIYNLWNDLKLTNNVGHFGNTEQAFVDDGKSRYEVPAISTDLLSSEHPVLTAWIPE